MFIDDWQETTYNSLVDFLENPIRRASATYTEEILLELNNSDFRKQHYDVIPAGWSDGPAAAAGNQVSYMNQLHSLQWCQTVANDPDRTGVTVKSPFYVSSCGGNVTPDRRVPNQRDAAGDAKWTSIQPSHTSNSLKAIGPYSPIMSNRYNPCVVRYAQLDSSWRCQTTLDGLETTFSGGIPTSVDENGRNNADAKEREEQAASKTTTYVELSSRPQSNVPRPHTFVKQLSDDFGCHETARHNANGHVSCCTLPYDVGVSCGPALQMSSNTVVVSSGQSPVVSTFNGVEMSSPSRLSTGLLSPVSDIRR
jgi:hypothetical protein